MHQQIRRLLPLLVLAAGCGEPAPVEVPKAVELASLPPGSHRESVEIPGVGRVAYAIEIPATYDGTTPVPLVLALHYGYDGSKPDPYTGGEMIKMFGPGLAGLNAIVIAPDALGGDWTDSKNEKAAVALTRSIMKTYKIDPKKIVITGYSLGGEGTWFIGSRHQDLFTAAIPVAAPVAGGNASWKIPVYVIHSNADQVVSYSAAKSHADTLKSKGTKLEFKTVQGLSHFETPAFGAYLGDAVEWLKSQWQ